MDHRVLGNFNRSGQAGQPVQNRSAAGVNRPFEIAFQNHGFVSDLALTHNDAVEDSSRARRQRAERMRGARVNELAVDHRAMKLHGLLGAAQNSFKLAPEESRSWRGPPLAREHARHLVVNIDRRQTLESSQLRQRSRQVGIKAQQSDIDRNPAIVQPVPFRAAWQRR